MRAADVNLVLGMGCWRCTGTSLASFKSGKDMNSEGAVAMDGYLA